MRHTSLELHCESCHAAIVLIYLPVRPFVMDEVMRQELAEATEYVNRMSPTDAFADAT